MSTNFAFANCLFRTDSGPYPVYFSEHTDPLTRPIIQTKKNILNKRMEARFLYQEKLIKKSEYSIEKNKDNSYSPKNFEKNFVEIFLKIKSDKLVFSIGSDCKHEVKID